jgi:hypothetical protein
MTVALKQNLPKAITLAVVCLLSLTLTSPAFGQATSITSTGYRATEGGGGAITTVYTTGNLGNTWSEGEWVPYQLIISNVQTDFPGLVGFPDIIMEYDFTAQNDARFVDLVRSIQVGTTELTDAQGWPRDDGSAYPMGTRPNIEDAQNDVGNTGDLENIWTGFAHLNLPNSQVNRDAPPGYGDGTPTDQFRYFYITKQDLIDAGVLTTDNTIIIYYQLHESRSFVWFNSLQEQYDADQTDDWGGYVYSLPAFAADSRNGSGFVPGSSGQLRVSFGGGDKTVPIPIPERLPGAVSGLKWRDQNGNGIIDGGEETLSGWRIFVEGTLENINFSTSILTDEFGDYSFPNLTSNVIWTISEDVNREVPFENDFMQTYPMPGDIVGVGTGVTLPADPNFGDYGWDVALTEVDSDQGDMNFGNKQCEIAIFCPPNITIDCNDPDGPGFTGSPTVESNCDPVSTSSTDVVIDGDCDVDGYLYQIQRTWIASDGIGKADTCLQVITVTDTTPPVITCPADVTFECDDVGAFGFPTAEDDCDDNVDISEISRDSTVGDCDWAYTLVIGYEAVDDCGNADTCYQTVTVEDTTPPEITCPADQTFECDAVGSFGSPTATDNCDPNPAISEISRDSTVGDCDWAYTLVIGYEAADGCGNTDTCYQTITVEDTTPPEITCPADVFATCSAPGELGEATATDNCDPAPEITFEDDTTSFVCPLEITRTWVATDGCGNADTCQQSIVISDDTPPVISCPPDVTFECDAVGDFGTPTATDNCGVEAINEISRDSTVGDCGWAYTLVIGYEAVDGCGNTDTCYQTITVEDTTPPEITCPADQTFECDAVGSFGSPTATDNCDPSPAISEISRDSTVGDCDWAYTLVIGYEAADGCGNTDTCYQTITVEDTTPPEITCPADVFATCTVPGELGEATATDNCDPAPVITFEDDTTSIVCPLEITRTWVATDGCGNADTCQQSIVISDDTPPVISCPPDVTFECDAVGDFGTPTATDNCGVNAINEISRDSTAGDCGWAYTLVIGYEAVDGCGNTDTCYQTVTVEDTTPPEITCPDDTTFQCDAIGEFGTATATDNCDPSPAISEISRDSTAGGCDWAYTLVIGYEAADACGNADTCYQTVIVEDTLAPVITCAPEDTIACEDELIFTPPTAEDNCDPGPFVIDTVSFDSAAGPGAGEWTYVMCWTAADACGNVSDTCCQTIIREACGTGCTFTIGGWGSTCPESQMGDMYSTMPGCIRDHYFAFVFPGGEVVVGHSSGYTARWTSAEAVRDYLPSGNTPATLTGDLVNPSTEQGNVLLSQVLGLTLNREYICAGVFQDLGLWPDAGCYGDHIVGDCGGEKFDTLTVDQFLDLANKVVAGKTNMLNDYNATLSDVNYTATCLNELFNECDPFADLIIIPSFEVADDFGDDLDPTLPTVYDLSQNSPNPFNPVTEISFSLPDASYVRLTVYNILGQVMANLVDGNLEAGFHSAIWDGNNVASGIYLYRLEVGNIVFTKKMVLLK